MSDLGDASGLVLWECVSPREKGPRPGGSVSRPRQVLQKWYHVEPLKRGARRADELPAGARAWNKGVLCDLNMVCREFIQVPGGNATEEA